MKVEILGVDDTIARCRVSDKEYGPWYEFAVSAPEPAHQLLQLMVRNAARQLAELRVKEEMDHFMASARRKGG